MTRQEVSIARIKVPSAHRQRGDLESLARSIKELGLLHPITVDRDYRLLAGHRRFTAVKSLGWKSIPVHVVTVGGLRRELVTLEENLTQLPLSDLERSLQLARQHEVYEALHPETRPVQVRGGPGRGKTSDKVSPVSFTVRAAQVEGVDRRTIQRRIELAKRLHPEAAERLRDHPIAHSQVDLGQLSKLRPQDQVQVANILLRGGARSTKGAVRELAHRRATKGKPADGRYHQLHTGDFAVTMSKVEPASIDLLVTDPEWRKGFARYDELAVATARVLSPRGVAVIMIGQDYLPQLLQGLMKHLTYRWTLAVMRPWRQTQNWGAGMMSGWLPAVVVTKGAPPRGFESDVVKEETHPNKKRAIKWEKDEGAFAQIIERFSEPGARVLDPFCGAGSSGAAALRLARYYVGGDIDPDRVAATSRRLASAKWADPQVKRVEPKRGKVITRWSESR